MARLVVCLVLLCQFYLVYGVNWIACASEGGTCNSTPYFVWARYGEGDNWTYRAVWNATWPCDDTYFGNPGTDSNSCYFRRAIPPSRFFKYVCTENENFIMYTNATTSSTSVYIGDLMYGDYSDKQYYLQSGIGYFSCSSGQFGGEPESTGSGRDCWISASARKWQLRECAFDSQPCTVPESSAIYPIIYSGYATDGYYTFDVKYGSSSGPYDCSKSMFPGTYPPQNSDNKCFYDPERTIQFVAPNGEWVQVESCEGNVTCSYSLSYGVTSTTSQATTAGWSTSLSDTIEENLFFEKDSLTTTVSSSVSNTISSAYSQTVTKSCSASCNIGPTGVAYLWQFQVFTREVNYEDPSEVMEPFTTFACNYLCTNSTQAPQCPPGYCADPACQTCTTQIYRNASPEDPSIKTLEENDDILVYFDEDVEPELRQKLISKGYVPYESLPPHLKSMADQMPIKVKRV